MINELISLGSVCPTKEAAQNAIDTLGPELDCLLENV